jgi:hypothetical protein
MTAPSSFVRVVSERWRSGHLPALDSYHRALAAVCPDIPWRETDTLPREPEGAICFVHVGTHRSYTLEDFDRHFGAIAPSIRPRVLLEMTSRSSVYDVLMRYRFGGSVGLDHGVLGHVELVRELFPGRPLVQAHRPGGDVIAPDYANVPDCEEGFVRYVLRLMQALEEGRGI